MINLCSATTIQHWFSKFYKLFETFREFRVFVFRYRATNENAELEENKIRVIFDWENLWKGIRVSLGIILRLFYQQRKEIMIFRGFPGIDLARTKPITNQQFLNWIRLIQVGNILCCRFETLLFSFETDPEFIYLSQCLC